MSTVLSLIVRVNRIINRNTGFILVATVVIFGTAILGFQKDNKEILSGINQTIKGQEQLIIGQQDTITRIDEKTQEIIDNSAEQTIVLCNFIVAHDLGSAPESSVHEIEEICEQKIKQITEARENNRHGFNSSFDEPLSNSSTPPQTSQNNKTDNNGNNTNSSRQNPPSQPNIALIPDVIERPARNLINRVFN